LLVDEPTQRRRYFDAFLRRSAGRGLVFLDPDNGLEVKSVPRGRRDSCKYLYWDELAETYRAGHSVLVYQHYPRVSRQDYRWRLARETGRRLGATEVWQFSTPHVVFLLVPQRRHAAGFAARSVEVQGVWGEPPASIIVERVDLDGQAV
jgi:hypothetical protein